VRRGGIALDAHGAAGAIAAGHQASGQRFDGANPDLLRALAGARRAAVREQRKAAPLGLRLRQRSSTLRARELLRRS
jgi:hypothetical protein